MLKEIICHFDYKPAHTRVCVHTCVCVCVCVHVCVCVCVAVSSGCHNKFPHIEWLKTTEIYAHGFEGQKSKMKTVLLEGAREIMLPCLFQLLAASSKPRLVAVAPVSPSSCVCLKLPLPSSWNDTGQWTCIIQVDFISKFICKNCFCEEAHTQVPVIWHGHVFGHIFLEAAIQLTTLWERECVYVYVYTCTVYCAREDCLSQVLRNALLLPRWHSLETTLGAKNTKGNMKDTVPALWRS